MILIISDSDDGSTSDVIKWLIFFKKSFIRINENSVISIEKIFINTDVEIILKAGERQFSFSEITSIWYRRGRFLFYEDQLISASDLSKEIVRSSVNELRTVRDFLYLMTKTKRSINYVKNASVNKLLSLLKAAESGLQIPSSIVSSNKNIVEHFYLKNEEIITKPVFESPFIRKSPMFKIYTSEFSEVDIQKLPMRFFTSLFQKKLNKKYELRIFYLNGVCRSMAIFSQSDSQTSIDFRRYKGNKPNRKTPFNLPEIIVEKIQLFMGKMDLNCGSIDMVVTTENEYVFLEVNPVGQFGMVSYPCNYNLEKMIANYL